VIEAVVEERFDDLFDPDFQVIFGYFPPESAWIEYFGSRIRFRSWRNGIVYRWVYHLRDSNHPETDKIHLSREFYNAIGQEPEKQRLRRRKPPKRRK
jgi:hypothetical protein